MDRRQLHRSCRGPAPPGVVVQAAMSLPPPTRSRNAGPAQAARPTLRQLFAPLPPIQHRQVVEQDYELLVQEFSGLPNRVPDAYERCRSAATKMIEVMSLDHHLLSTLVLDAPNVHKAKRPAELIYRNMQTAKGIAKVGPKVVLSDEFGKMAQLAGTISKMVNRSDEDELERLKHLLLDVDLDAKLYGPLYYALQEEEEEMAKMMRRALRRMQRNERDLAPPVPRVQQRRRRTSRDAPQSPKRRRTDSGRRSNPSANDTAQLGDVSALVLSPASTIAVHVQNAVVPQPSAPVAVQHAAQLASPPTSAVPATPPLLQRRGPSSYTGRPRPQSPTRHAATRLVVQSNVAAQNVARAPARPHVVAPSNPPAGQASSPPASTLPANPPALQRRRAASCTERPLPQSPTRHVTQSAVRTNGASTAAKASAPTSPIPSAQPSNPPPIPPKRNWSARPDVQND